MGVALSKRLGSCQAWDSNPQLQERLPLECSGLNCSPVLTAKLKTFSLTWLGTDASTCAVTRPGSGRRLSGCPKDRTLTGRRE